MGQAGVLVGPTQASRQAACGAIGQRPPSPRLSQGGWGRLEGTPGREVGGGEEPGDHKLLSLLAQECHVDVAQDQAQIQPGGGEAAFSPKPTAATHTRDRTATSCQPRRVPSPTPSKLLSSESHSPVPRGGTHTGSLHVHMQALGRGSQRFRDRPEATERLQGTAWDQRPGCLSALPRAPPSPIPGAALPQTLHPVTFRQVTSSLLPPHPPLCTPLLPDHPFPWPQGLPSTVYRTSLRSHPPRAPPLSRQRCSSPSYVQTHTPKQKRLLNPHDEL